MTRQERCRDRSRPSRPDARRPALVPDVFHIAPQIMNAVKVNIGFTAIYNLIKLALASLCLCRRRLRRRCNPFSIWHCRRRGASAQTVEGSDPRRPFRIGV